ncbi:hypothetical protein BDY21DRAFT_353107 [Lineolata rhizophorae]|uniref:Short chain dehydrogenase/reductase family protein-like protein n=1 Tax=Lineolata rhizophorae TaxID=578093 RepID=A0A6A6NRY3_9PEZI|nr:hypothetical protein BDY21DRAFT_353107 [Lineolata rhizophorae]
MSGSSKPPHLSASRPPPFPPHNAPRVWFITSGTSPLGIAVARQVLAHGDCVVAGVLPAEFECEEGRSAELREFIESLRSGNDGAAAGATGKSGTTVANMGRRLRVVGLDSRIMGQCQSAVAEAEEAFGRIDILLGCTTEAVVGAIEELSLSNRTQTLVRDQFETNFFANVNVIKAVLPSMRARKNGHIVMVTGITAHLGTPGLGIYSSSQWAIEGYCDSLAYEIAPFNIKMTIVQPMLETNVLTNRITSVPQLPQYHPRNNPAPLAREVLSRVLDRLDGGGSGSGLPPSSDQPSHPAAGHGAQGPDPDPDVDMDRPADTQQPRCCPSPTAGPSSDPSAAATASSGTSASTTPSHAQQYPPPPLMGPDVSSLYPSPPPSFRAAVTAETVYALTAIGGHDNPPARHIVGLEGVISVKDKLKNVNEELEDFLSVSSAVDIEREESS